MKYQNTSRSSKLLIYEYQPRQSRRKIGFLGFLISINSLGKLYTKYVIQRPSLKFILTNKLSQESRSRIILSAIRSRGGFNNNPAARQFEAAYKRLLVHTEIVGPGSGTITHAESLSILTHGSGRHLTCNENGDDMAETSASSDIQEAINDSITHDFLTSNAWNLTPYIQDIVAYIACFYS
nr:unnamed protein product [Callosobruchus analis]